MFKNIGIIIALLLCLAFVGCTDHDRVVTQDGTTVASVDRVDYGVFKDPAQVDHLAWNANRWLNDPKNAHWSLVLHGDSLDNEAIVLMQGLNISNKLWLARSYRDEHHQPADPKLLRLQQRVAIQTAKGLLHVFDLTWDERRAAPSIDYGSDRDVRFDNAVTTVAAITRLLEESSVPPESIGLSADQLRDLVRRDIARYFTMFDGSTEERRVKAMARQAMVEYHFSAADFNVPAKYLR